MLNIISWTLIIVFGLLYIICFIGPMATVKEESKNSYLLLLCLFFTFICIYPIKEIYSALIALRVWQISFSAVLLDSILLIALCKRDRYNAIITSIICAIFTILPFYNSIEFSNEITPISIAAKKFEVRIDYLSSIIGVCVSLILIACTFIVMKRTRKIGMDYQLMDLLQQNIKLYSRQESFHKPMETLWSYEANSKLKLLDISIKKCLTEIRQLAQKPFLPNSIFTANIDDLRPMIYNMSAEISKLNNLVSKQEYQTNLPNEFSAITELNHSLATPLSQIEVNCELLKPKVKGTLHPQIERIIQYVNFCRTTILAFKEVLSSSINGDSNGYMASLTECFNMYCNKCNKTTIKFNFNTEENIGISKNILISIISPMLENAVDASPDGREISLVVSQQDNSINIILENECTIPPKLSDLKTIGFSSKEGHIGTGLNTVRHFLVLLGGKELQISINQNKIQFTLNIPIK